MGFYSLLVLFLSLKLEAIIFNDNIDNILQFIILILSNKDFDRFRLILIIKLNCIYKFSNNNLTDTMA